MVYHFGVGCQQPSPTCALRANALACSNCLGCSPCIVALAPEVSDAATGAAHASLLRHHSLEINVVVPRDYSRSRLHRHASTRESARTNCTVPLRLRQQGYVASRPPTVTQLRNSQGTCALSSTPHRPAQRLSSHCTIVVSQRPKGRKRQQKHAFVSSIGSKILTSVTLQWKVLPCGSRQLT